ncbi:predicted protein [Botrytis cinerea T4]|uniref:Uncharacterized protein n=1 Tax=Botryotinia fuckeliana (strain T4) TaxID=999810 RepID=G2YZK1_BOTF4|nr:predicted protein [Botrytis cinerea T4]
MDYFDGQPERMGSHSEVPIMPQQIMLDPPLTENDPGPLNTTVRTLLFEKREGE